MSYRSPIVQYKYSRSVSRNHQRDARMIDQSNFMANYFNLPFVCRKRQCDQESVMSPVIKLKNYNQMKDSTTKKEEFGRKRQGIPQESLTSQTDEYEDSHILSKPINNRIIDPNNTYERDQVSLRSKTTRVRKQYNTEETIDYETHRTDEKIRNQDVKIKQLRSKTLATNDSVKNLNKTETLRTEETDQTMLNKMFQSSIVRDKQSPDLRKAQTILRGTNPFQEIENQYNRRRKYLEMKKNSKEKLKIYILFVRAAMRLSKKYRKTKKLIKLEQQRIQDKIDIHQQYLNKYRLQDIKSQNKKYVSIISSKMVHYFDNKKYLQECLFLWQKEENQLIKDIRRIRFCGFSMMFMKNLEFLTRPDYLPTLIQHQINLSLFNNKNKNISQFVMNRCKFYQTKITKLTINEKLLIGTEYFIYEIIVPNLLDLGNELDTDYLPLKNQTQYYIVGIISLLQTLFTNYFQKISIIEQSKVKGQKNLKVSIDKKTGHMDIKVEIHSKLDEDETKLLQGCFNKDVMQEIFINKIKWTEQVHTLFELILQNLEKQIKV